MRRKPDAALDLGHSHATAILPGEWRITIFAAAGTESN